MPFDLVTKDYKPQYAAIVSRLIENSYYLAILVDVVANWQTQTGYGLVLALKSTQLLRAANKMFDTLRAEFGDDWDDPENIIDDEHKQVCILLKTMTDNEEHKKDLQLALARHMRDSRYKFRYPGLDDDDSRPSKQSRTSGRTGRSAATEAISDEEEDEEESEAEFASTEDDLGGDNNRSVVHDDVREVGSVVGSSNNRKLKDSNVTA
ncbi:hypothetical protein LTR64_006947 [Lithohypha guttulata]|uniref:uncharacterized protein n=1 Tax=Lithohypha guttulata TaxID=1690604 RepID=UPI002DDDE889|nr:hypothetical protein LTR51_004496 [Lithohypha guttulata]